MSYLSIYLFRRRRLLKQQESAVKTNSNRASSDHRVSLEFNNSKVGSYGESWIFQEQVEVIAKKALSEGNVGDCQVRADFSEVAFGVITPRGNHRLAGVLL